MVGVIFHTNLKFMLKAIGNMMLSFFPECTEDGIVRDFAAEGFHRAGEDDAHLPEYGGGNFLSF